MEPRRIALAAVLMAAVIISWTFLFPDQGRNRSALTAGADSASIVSTREGAKVDAIGRTSPDSATLAGAAASPRTGVRSGMGAAPGSVGSDDVDESGARLVLSDSADESPAPPIDTTAITTARAVFRTTNRGAALIGATLPQYRELSDKGRTKGGPVELVNPGDRLLGYRLAFPGDTIRLGGTIFQETRSEANGLTNVTYTAQIRDWPVSITYSFLPDSYRVNIAVRVDGAPAEGFLLVDMPSGFGSSEADSSDDHSHLSYVYKPEKQSAKGITFKSLDPGERRIESGPLTWVVAKNKYFLFGLLTPVDGPGFAELDVIGGTRVSKVATRAEATVITPLANGGVNLEVYAGPQEFRRLAAVGREFETSNPYGGWLQGLVQPFATMVIKALLWMKGTFGLSYGWILVLFGVVVRVVLWPLNQRAMRSSMQMQRLQPELQAIQKKYKGEPQKLQAEMMKLYKAHGTSPFSSVSGCLPMLIPLPIFFALFFVFQNTIEFRGVSFLWLPDISIKDPLYLLPILVAITALLLSWIGMRGTKVGDQQKMMMYMMPAMMLFIFLNMAAGLNLYYLVQNLASLPQQWLIAKERGKLQPALVKG